MLYHSAYYLMPYVLPVPVVLTFYDLIPVLFPDQVSARARLLFRFTAQRAVRTADAVVSISRRPAGTCSGISGLRRPKS